MGDTSKDAVMTVWVKINKGEEFLMARGWVPCRGDGDDDGDD